MKGGLEGSGQISRHCTLSLLLCKESRTHTRNSFVCAPNRGRGSGPDREFVLLETFTVFRNPSLKVVVRVHTSVSLHYRRVGGQTHRDRGPDLPVLQKEPPPQSLGGWSRTRAGDFGRETRRVQGGWRGTHGALQETSSKTSRPPPSALRPQERDRYTSLIPSPEKGPDGGGTGRLGSRRETTATRSCRGRTRFSGGPGSWKVGRRGPTEESESHTRLVDRGEEGAWERGGERAQDTDPGPRRRVLPCVAGGVHGEILGSEEVTEETVGDVGQ